MLKVPLHLSYSLADLDTFNRTGVLKLGSSRFPAQKLSVGAFAMDGNAKKTQHAWGDHSLTNPGCHMACVAARISKARAMTEIMRKFMKIQRQRLFWPRGPLLPAKRFKNSNVKEYNGCKKWPWRHRLWRRSPNLQQLLAYHGLSSLLKEKSHNSKCLENEFTSAHDVAFSVVEWHITTEAILSLWSKHQSSPWSEFSRFFFANISSKCYQISKLNLRI